MVEISRQKRLERAEHNHPFLSKLHAETSTWNPRKDIFTSRRPEPLYTFLKKQCLCHRMQPNSDDVFSYSTEVLGAQWSTKLRTLVEGNVSTFSLGFLIHRSHLEDGLQSVIRACIDREGPASRMHLPAGTQA